MENEPRNRLELTDRRCLHLEGVEHVGTFDENEISLDTNMGFLLLKGENLHITELNLETGKLMVEGYIAQMLFYNDRSAQGAKTRGKNVLSRIFK